MHLSEWITALEDLKARHGDAVLSVAVPSGLPKFQVESIGTNGYETELVVTPWFAR